MKKHFLLWVLCLISLELYAQAPQLYSTQQGLVSTRIEQIMFDRDNFLWISTDEGLCRFEGQNFTTYQRQEGNPFTLQENHTNSMFEDADGKHWLGASDGLYYVCRTENSLTRYVMDSAQMLISISGVRPHPVRRHSLLVGSYGMGIFVFDTETCRVNRPATDSLQWLMRKRNCQHIWTDRHKQLWIMSPTQLQCIDLQEMRDVPLPDLGNEEIVIQDVVEDTHNDRLYFATLNRGLLYCDLVSNRIKQVDFPELNHRNLTALAISPDGSVVIGTEGQGLWSLRQGKLTHVEVNDCPVDLDHVKIHSIAYDDQRNLWLGIFQKGLLMVPSQERLFFCRPIKQKGELYNRGTISSFASMSNGSRLYGIDGAGLLCENPDGSTQVFTTDNSPLLTNAVLSVEEVPGNMAYVGTYNYGLYQFDGKSLKRDPYLHLLDKQSIMSMVHDSLTQTLFIGTNGDGIYSYQTQTHELKRITGEWHLLWIVSLAIDSHHRLWTSSEGNMACFNLENGTRIVPQYSLPTRAYGFSEDANGTMWIATSHGLMSFGPGCDSLQLVHVNGKPLTGVFTSLLQSKDGKLWMPSHRGLYCYDPLRKTLSRYVDPEIAAVGSFCLRSAHRWPNGALTFGGDNGALEFRPEQVLAYHRQLRPIQFTRLWINNVPTDYNPNLSPDENVLDKSLWKASRLHLGPSENSISLSFAVHEFANPLGIHYSYRLEGYEKNWHEVFGQDNTASYSSLPWGNYTLQVRASMTNGSGSIQTTEKELEIVIDAPLYASWWARLIYAVLSISAVGSFLNFLRLRAHQRRILRRAEHNRQIKEAKLRMFTLVSHEIKTPLTLIISPLRRLMQRNNDNATQSVYEMMYRSSLRILMLITQQMDVRKIDNGQMRLHVREIPLRSFLDDIMQFFSNNALSRKIDFRLLLPDEDQELMLCCDPDQLDKVFFNLLSNAFKYVNDTGQVLIKVFPDQRKKVICIEIFNSGSHIKEGENIFQRFGSDGSESLGLSLANDLTELHHGTLSVRNSDEGVTFSVTLPMGDEHFTEAEKAVVERPETTEQDQLELEARAIREDGNEVTADGKELIEMLSEELHEKQRLRERRARLNFNIENKPLTSADEKLLNRVSECISKNMADPDFNVEDLAAQVGISRIHLNRKLKELIDTTPSALIKNTRLKQGAFLLVQSDVSIAEVAYSVGFNSPAYFSANFAAYFKMTPKEFVNAYTDDADNPELKKLLEQ